MTRSSFKVLHQYGSHKLLKVPDFTWARFCSQHIMGNESSEGDSNFGSIKKGKIQNESIINSVKRWFGKWPWRQKYNKISWGNLLYSHFSNFLVFARFPLRFLQWSIEVALWKRVMKSVVTKMRNVIILMFPLLSRFIKFKTLCIDSSLRREWQVAMFELLFTKMFTSAISTFVVC